MKLSLIAIVVLVCASSTWSYIVDPGPVVIASSGLVWPQPKKITIEKTFAIIRPQNFNFNVRN